MHQKAEDDFIRPPSGFVKTFSNIQGVRLSESLSLCLDTPTSPVDSDQLLNSQPSCRSVTSACNLQIRTASAPLFREINTEIVQIFGSQLGIIKNDTLESASPNNMEEALPNLQDHREQLALQDNEEIKIEEDPAIQRSTSFHHTVIEVRTQQPSTTTNTTNLLSSSTGRLAGVQGSPFQLLLASLRSIPNIHPKLNIFRALIWCTVIGVLSFIGVLCSYGEIPYYIFATVISCYLAFSILENIVRAHCSERAEWIIREDLLNIIDAMSGIILMICMQHPSLASIVIAAVPCAVLAATYISLTKTSTVTKLFGGIARFLYSVQASTVMLRLAGYMSWDWRLMLIPTWLFFTLSLPPMVFFSITLLYDNLALAIKYLINRKFYHPDYLKQAALALWLFGYSVLDCLGAAYVFGITMALQGSDVYQFLKLITLLGLILYSVLILSAIFCMLKIFYQYPQLLSVMQIIENPIEEEAQAEVETVLQKSRKTKLSFKTVKQTQYFLRSSDCYFIPLAANALLKYQESMQRGVIEILITNYRSIF